MDAENYVIQYPLDAVHVDKFADLLGKPKTAVSEMVKANKLPIIRRIAAGCFSTRLSVITVISRPSGFSERSEPSLTDSVFWCG